MENINNKNKRMFVNVKTRKVTSMDNNVIFEQYDRNGNLIFKKCNEFEVLKSEEKREYDAYNNCIHKVKYDGNKNTSFECWRVYNENNLLIHYKELYGKEYNCIYDELNRLELMVYKNGDVKRFVYDENDNVITEYKFYTNINHNLKSVDRNFKIKGDHIETHYKYDKNNNCIHVKTINTRNNSILEDTSYMYDKRGNCIIAIFDDKSITYNKYDKRGNCLFTKSKYDDKYMSWNKYKYDKNNNIILSYSNNCYSKSKYCKHGIVEDKYYIDDTVVKYYKYKYDKHGHLIEKINMLNNRIEMRYEYDKFGNLIHQEDLNGYYTNIEYEYFE